MNKAECIINAVESSVQDAEFQDMVKKFIATIRSIAKEEVKCIKHARFNIAKIIM